MENINKLIKLIDKYKKKLDLEDYRLEIIISEEEHLISDKNTLTKQQKADYLAEVTKRYPNSKSYDIVFNKGALKEDLKDTIKHEFLHILLWALIRKIESLIDLGGFDTKTKEKFCKDIEDEEHEIIKKIIKHIK